MATPRGGHNTEPTETTALASPPPVSCHGSLLDDWRGWPENDPQFDPFLDSAWSLSDEFCKCTRPSCAFCSETREVFHICEYTASGQSVLDRKVNTKELDKHLRALEKLDATDEKTPNHPAARLFFACGNHVTGGLRYAYMRRFLAFCRIPTHLVLKRRSLDELPIFQSAYRIPDQTDFQSKPKPGILHIYLQCHCYRRGADIVRKSGYYSATFESKVRSWTSTVSYSPLSPSLYLRYNESSRETVVYVADCTITFDRVKGIFSSRRVGQDPFLVVAAYLQQRIADIQGYLRSRRSTLAKAIEHTLTMESLGASSSSLFARFEYLARDGPSVARMRHEVSSIVRAIRDIEVEYEAFVKRTTDIYGDAPQAHALRSRFRQQLSLALGLESAFLAQQSGNDVINTLLMGRAQIVNGIDMATLTKDNKTQAEATEALARDARRDGEIMKTITVVTLVYLPATFVSTLLSMGIFDFGAGKDDDGRLRIAREGWVFFAISLPLTFLTLGLAYVRAQSKERQWARERERELARAREAASAVDDEQKPSGDGEGVPEVGDEEKLSDSFSTDTGPRESLGGRFVTGWHPRRRTATTELEAGNAKM